MYFFDRLFLVAVLVGTAAATACSFDASFDGTQFRCAADLSCPQGFDCVSGICLSDDRFGPDGGDDESDGGTGPDATVGVQVWRDDGFADFATPGHTDTFAAIEARGAIEPAAYYTGGLLMRASGTGTMSSGATSTWEQVQGFTSTGRTALARTADLNLGSQIPAGLGLTSGDDWTVSMEGELWLEAGTWTLALIEDDHGFVDLAAPGTTAFARAIDADFSGEEQASFTAAVDGWYPIRWAVSDTGGNARATLRFSGPGVAALIPIPRHRLRTRVDQLTGLAMTGFDDELMCGDGATTIDNESPAYADWASGFPPDLGITDDDDFSVRWAGQFRVDLAGDYRFRYRTDDGQRMWIDGVPVFDAWDQSSHDVLSLAVPLTVGWHDVVIDGSEHVVTGSARLTVALGPEPGLIDQQLPIERLRPVEGRANRLETAREDNDVTIPDLGNVTTTVTLDGPPGAVVTALDLNYRFTHTFPGDLVVTLTSPNGTQATLRNRVNSQGGSITDRYVLVGGSFAGATVAGTWTLRFRDLQGEDAGLITDFQLTAHYAGGEPPIATEASYESAVRDLGGEAAIEQVTWEAREPDGTAVTVLVRTCDDAAACAAAPWSALANPAGSVPAVAPGRFAQYRVELTSTGDAVPALEWIQLEYR